MCHPEVSPPSGFPVAFRANLDTLGIARFLSLEWSRNHIDKGRATMSDSSRGVLLIVEDEPSKCATLRSELIDAGYEVRVAFDNTNAIQALGDSAFRAVISDQRSGAGLALLDQIRRQFPQVRVI